MLKRSRGNLTHKQILRCAQMSGAFGRQLDRIVTTSCLGDMLTSVYTAPEKPYVRDIPLVVEEYGRRKLCAYKPQRTPHRGFVGLTNSGKIYKPISMGKKIRDLAQRMDDWRRLALNPAM